LTRLSVGVEYGWPSWQAVAAAVARSSPGNHSIMAKVAKSRARKSAKKRRKRPAAQARPARAGLGKKLVVVESPAKARTINRYLGSDYVVRASMGHVRDLPKKEMGVDVENDFAPTYETIQRREKVLNELDKYAKAASDVFLATDLDREGEAIISEAGIASGLAAVGRGPRVKVSTLDAMFVRRAVELSYLKADLEGLEMELLRGGRETIRRFSPKIAITAYHRKDHAESIAGFLKEIDGRYRIRLKGIHHPTGAPVMLHAWVP